MSHIWTLQHRVEDRLEEITRELETARRARLGAKPAPILAARLAAALRGAADLLERAPNTARHAAPNSVRNSARGSAGA